MEFGDKKPNIPNVQGGISVHHVLAHSYSFFFLLFLLGALVHLLYPIRIVESSLMTPIGLALLVLASLLILWAQKTSRDLQKQNITRDTFCKGPYSYTRSPTHWGLFLLMLGFGIITNALFIIIFSIISFVVTKTFFLKKEEELLAEKYGAPYLEYKKLVRF